MQCDVMLALLVFYQWYPIQMKQMDCFCCESCCCVQIGAAVGLPFPQWYEAGAAPLPSTVHGEWSFGE
jgi:hypothetical protein